MEYLGYFISDLSSLIPVAAGIYFFKRLKTDRKLLLYFFIYTSIVELSNAWMASHRIHNLWSINIYTLVEYSFFVFILNKWIKEIFMRWLSLIGSVLFYPLWFGYFILNKTLDINNAPASITESCVLALLSAFAVVTLGLKTETPVFKNYRFWFAGAAFVYFAVSILLDYIFALLFDNNTTYNSGIWNIHSVINIAVNIVFAYAFSLAEV